MAASTIALTVTAATSAVSSSSTTVRAAPQGGVFEGLNPSQYNASNPIILFIIQVCIQRFSFNFISHSARVTRLNANLNRRALSLSSAACFIILSRSCDSQESLQRSSVVSYLARPL